MTIYIKPGCPWCIDVEAYLKKNGYEYERINVIADRAAFKRMGEIFGTTSAPSMTVGDLKLATLTLFRKKELPNSPTKTS